MAVSSDGVYGGIYVQGTEINIYRFMAPNGDLLPEKIVSRPVATHQAGHGNWQKMTEMYIFKKPGGVGGEQADYQMYVLFEEGILLFNDISRRLEPSKVYDF